ncbi:MAG TPA: hypothetical protein PKD98_15510, partial [Anaerolineae bacterium]|nr:hypothetical protein [Anaerolineae bacterium]
MRNLRINRWPWPRAGLIALLLTLLLATTAGATLINRKISGVMPPFGEVLDFKISPDGSRVVYLADRETDEVSELYSLTLPDGALIKLNSPLVSGGAGIPFQNNAHNKRGVLLGRPKTEW